MKNIVLIDRAITAFIYAAFACIPGGLILQYFFPDGFWWLLSAGALILFMAG